MLQSVLHHYRRLRENNVGSLLKHPRLLMGYHRHTRETARRPRRMTTLPTSIEIELTNRCNLACVQCLRSRGLRRYALGDITFENYRRLLAQFPDVLSVCLNGFGEPLLHPAFGDIVAYTRAERPWAKILIYSNGMLLDDARVTTVLKSGLSEINVSIDAALPDTYRRVRRGGRLEVVHENLRRLLRRRREAGARFPLVGVNFVMLNENEGELVRFVEQAAVIGVDFVNCISLATYDWGFANRRSADNYAREVADVVKRLSELGLTCRSRPPAGTDWARADKPFDCPFFWGDSLRITYAGDVTLGCCTPFRESYSYGNALDTPFVELWNNDRFEANRQSTLDHIAPTESCRSCAAFSAQFYGREGLRP